MPQVGQDFLPSYKFAKIATRDKFLDLVDNHAPLLAAEVYPGAEDFKSQKVTITFTSAPSGKPTEFFKHNLDISQALNMLHMMRWGHPGDPARDGMLPGFPDMKGYRDPMYKQWEYTSHICEVKYMTHLKGQPLNSGPNYVFEFSYGPGTARMVGGKPGIVMPVQGAERKKASIMVPVFGNKDNKPGAMYFVENALLYLHAREVTRQERIAKTLDNLRYWAQSDPNARLKLDALYETLRGKRKEVAPAQPMTPAQAQGEYASLVADQQGYEQQDPQLYQQAYDQGQYGA